MQLRYCVSTNSAWVCHRKAISHVSDAAWPRNFTIDGAQNWFLESPWSDQLVTAAADTIAAKFSWHYKCDILVWGSAYWTVCIHRISSTKLFTRSKFMYKEHPHAHGTFSLMRDRLPSGRSLAGQSILNCGLGNSGRSFEDWAPQVTSVVSVRV